MPTRVASAEAPAGSEPLAWLVVTDGRGLGGERGGKGPQVLLAEWGEIPGKSPSHLPAFTPDVLSTCSAFSTIKPLFCYGDLFLVFLQPGPRSPPLLKPDLHLLPYLPLLHLPWVNEGAPSSPHIYFRNKLKGSVSRPPFVYRRANSKTWATGPSSNRW